MSLINRMLRDLSSRAPASGNVMGGIQVASPTRARGHAAKRLGFLLLFVVIFSAVLWPLLSRKAPPPVPTAADPLSPARVPAPHRAAGPRPAAGRGC